MMNDTAALLSSMLPPYADALGLYDPNAGVPHHHHPPKPALMYRVPRVVADQKSKFESDELFRRLGRESETRYVGFRDRPIEERQARFINGCKEGHTEIAVVATGTNFQLVFSPLSIGYSSSENLDTCDFSKEPGKVHFRSRFILNGVCVRWRGWIDQDRLDGVGCLEFDEDSAKVEDTYRRDQVERFNQRLREFEEEQRAFRAAHHGHILGDRGDPHAEMDARKKMHEMAHHLAH
ncbi:protein big brother-like [Artemia franciscana]|uniref:Protein big brother n=1 Tax=Artemia franciscana TaxID=6661 RepID=A0AA88H2G0_ARTSF|nr:hypothetical protein QYM36_018427 [Artemia franciscana]